MNVDEYIVRYPRHCRECMGWGCHVYEDNHGVPGPGERVTDPCENCVGKGQCPRCSCGLDTEDPNLTCNFCGWVEDTEGANTDDYQSDPFDFDEPDFPDDEVPY